MKVIDDDGGDGFGSAAVLVNMAPSSMCKSVAATINENGVATLTLTFDDPGTLDSHTVEVDWGDGTIETLPVAAGARTFGEDPPVPGRQPNGNAVDVYTVNVKVRDDDGGQATHRSGDGLERRALECADHADRGDQRKRRRDAELTFDDPGTLDSHTVEVDWGDGTIETLPVTAGARMFTATHQYLDDNPTGTAADVYTVNVTVRR